MRKVYKKLTKDQVERGVIFSSELIGSDNIHEVLRTDEQGQDTIKNLLNDSFFNSSPFGHNEIRR